jgi:hypothetical protein
MQSIVTVVPNLALHMDIVFAKQLDEHTHVLS